MITARSIHNATGLSRERPARALVTRQARLADADAIARIYNQAIMARTSTFETEPRTTEDIHSQLIDRGSTYPTIVVERAGRVLGWASSSPHSTRACFARIAEFSVYVDWQARRMGVGRAALTALVAECKRRGFYKLLSRVFPENLASRVLCRTLGFREIGVMHCHAPVDGIWHDAVIVEKLLGQARLAEARAPQGQLAFGSDAPAHARDRGRPARPRLAGRPA